MPRRRRATTCALAACLGLLAPLAGCALSGATCIVGSCTVSLVGEHDSVTLDGEGLDGVVVSLQDAANGVATVTVAGSQTTCTQGQDVSAGGYGVFCSEVADDSVSLTISDR